jgi:tetratricopeptide (TPR) repeat protein
MRRVYRACVFALVLTGLLAGYTVSRGSEDGGPEYNEWSKRLAAAVKSHDAAQEVLCVTTIGRRWTWALPTLPHSMIERAASDSEHARLGEPRIEMLQMLYELRWKHRDGSEPSSWWLQLSLALLERKKPDEAFAVAAHITDPYTLIAMQADNRYRPIAKSQFVERDVLKAARNELEWRRTASERAPLSLSGVVGVARALMYLHRYDDVLRLTDGVMHADSVSYDDLPQQFPWILHYRARALSALGRYDEAIALLRRACEESKQDLVSHPLNLAEALAGLNRPQEALAALPPLQGASVYGHLVAALTRAMVASELNDSTAIAAALEELRGHVAEYPGMLQQALIVAGKQDEAAALLASRLSDPELRTDALVELQDYADTPAPPRVTQWREQLKALRNRPDVRHDITEQGRVGSYPLPGVTF